MPDPIYVSAPPAARRKARSALAVRATLPASRRGGLDAQEARAQGITSGVEQARRIAAGETVDARQVKAFFSRHRGNFEKARARGLTPATSRAMMAWDLWGGEPMRRFVTSVVASQGQSRKRGARPDTMRLVRDALRWMVG